MEGCWKRRQLTWTLTLLGLFSLFASNSIGSEAQWIWLPKVAKEKVEPGTTGFFRKTINLRQTAIGRVVITADDGYELFVNGRKVGAGNSNRKLDQYDISKFLVVGRNAVAIKVDNLRGNTAALVARLEIRPSGSDKWYSFSTDTTWRCTSLSTPMWQTTLFNDSSWELAQSFGELGNTVPWDRREEVVAEVEHQHSERFQIQEGFSVQKILEDKQTGSLIAMAFNEFGHIIAAKERGPLLLIFDRDGDGIPEEVRTYCDQIESVQGILPLNGEVFATGIGSEGPGLYRLTDVDRNGTLETIKLVFKFKGSPGEHGAHGLALGPDGMIYCVLGNHVQVETTNRQDDTYAVSYEGDLVPRYEDPGGHARGIKAPGGTIIRTDIDGKKIQRVAGGLRNAYDLMFHPDGGLFVHDSDMEADVGASWYRPTALFEITEGGEYGWRSGWAKWPNYYADRLPPVLETGRGSPAGGTIYDHFMFPVKYQNALFLADWSEGRILTVRIQNQGGSYRADSEVFLQGQPLNVTDLCVGPDGSLYFCTGGRGTSGGIYRVVWDGEIPERIKNLGSGVAAAIRQPQLESAWARQNIAGIKSELGNSWGELVAGVAYSDENPPHYRIRAMDLMQLFGPVGTQDLLVDLSEARSEPVRAKAAQLLGLNPGRRSARRLAEMLDDRDARVRRAACEAILRSQQYPNPELVIPLLREEDRSVTFAACRVLQRIPVDQWRDTVLQSNEAPIAILGSMSLMIADRTPETALQVLENMSQRIPTFLSDNDFVNLLRTVELALELGKIKPEDVRPLAAQIAEEFPTGEPRMNRELIRLAAYLDAQSLSERALQYIEGDAPLSERLHVAMYLRFLKTDWSPEQQFKLLKFYEAAAIEEAGSSVPLYVMNTTRDFGRKVLNERDAVTILTQGTTWPNAALAALYKIPQPVDENTASILRDLDEKIGELDSATGDVYRRLRTGIVAMLSAAGDDQSLAYLRKAWRDDPERRQGIALGLSGYPDGENWDYLVRSLNIMEVSAAAEVMAVLADVRIATDDPEALRQVILQGLKAKADGASSETASRLMSHWTGLQSENGESPSIEAWQKWYAKMYPDRPAAELPSMETESRWDFEQLDTYLASDSGKYGNPVNGAKVFYAAQCADCHRYDKEGAAVGPDLTNLAKRFTKREVLESILFPSHVISDQYINRRVLTLDGRVYVGLVSEDTTDGSMLVRNSNNEVTQIEASNVDQILPSTSSIMPGNLLDELSLQEISDLFAYLRLLPPLEMAKRP